MLRTSKNDNDCLLSILSPYFIRRLAERILMLLGELQGEGAGESHSLCIKPKGFFRLS